MLQKETATRIITALPLALVAIAVIMYLPPVFLLGLMAIFLVIASWEFTNTLKNIRLRLFEPIVYFQAVFIPGIYLYRGAEFTVQIILGMTLVYLFGWMTESVLMKKEKGYSKFYLIHLLWVTLPFVCALYIRVQENGSYMLLWLALIVTFSDIWAYFGGKRFGKHPLAPSLSPKKTIEGSLFGLLGALAVGLPFAYYLLSFEWVFVIIAIFAITFLGQFGDLMESKFKRFCGVKDAGNIIPGHGGVLDRVDAFLLALPFFCIILYFFYPEWRLAGPVMGTLY